MTARFNARGHKLTIVFSKALNAHSMSEKLLCFVTTRMLIFLDPYVTPGGDGLVFDKAALQVGLPELIAPFLPPEIVLGSSSPQRQDQLGAEGC